MPPPRCTYSRIPLDALSALKHAACLFEGVRTEEEQLIDRGVDKGMSRKACVAALKMMRVEAHGVDVPEGVHALFRRYYAVRRTHITQAAGSPYLRLAFEHRADLSFRALLDSGATHSIIGGDTVSRIATTVGDGIAQRWPKQRPDMTVTLANGKTVKPIGAVVLTIGLKTIQGEHVWCAFPFLVLDEVIDEVILGSDWEAETYATRFPPGHILGISMTEESRATYTDWTARVVADGAVARDIPALAFTHIVPFTRHSTANADENDRIAAPVTVARGPVPELAAEPQTRVVPTAPLARSSTAVSGAPTKPVPTPSDSEAKAHSASATQRAARPVGATLRSVQTLVIPPMSEVGPLPVSIHWHDGRRSL